MRPPVRTLRSRSARGPGGTIYGEPLERAGSTGRRYCCQRRVRFPCSVVTPDAPMWYPTLSDVLTVYERIASYEGRKAAVRDRSALYQAIIAPQRAGGDDPAIEDLSTKAAAFMIEIIRPRLFEPCTQRTAFALTSVFLDRTERRFRPLSTAWGNFSVRSPTARWGRRNSQRGSSLASRCSTESEAPSPPYEFLSLPPPRT